MSFTGESGQIVTEQNEKPICPICLELFSEPMSLPCGHTYCLPCLLTMSAGLDKNNCPECQQEYGGTKALEKNMKMCSIVKVYKATLESNGNAIQSGSGCVKEMTAIDDREVTCNQGTTFTQSQLESPKCHSKTSQKSTLPEGQDGRRTAMDSAGPPPAPPAQQSVATKKTEMEEPKFRLASQVTDLTVRLDAAECVLRKERERQEEATAANEELRAGAAKLLHAFRALTVNYSQAVTRLIEGQLSPGEEALRGRVTRALQLTEWLRHAALSAESLLTEQDEARFTQDLRLLQPRIAQLTGRPPAEEEEAEAEPGAGSKMDASLACARLEEMNADFKASVGEIHRSLRNVFNPSEVTFDPDTAHPNLVLSADMKTATYSAARRACPASPLRFTSFLQVLSSQSFYGGEHCWRVELEGAPWAIGVCYSRQLARSGLPSALESSRCSWCLMWFENRLRAFEQGHDVPLQLTTLSRTLEVRLSFKTHRLSFYNVSLSSGKAHVYTFKAHLTEPVHLAYRMMSGNPTARVTISEG